MNSVGMMAQRPMPGRIPGVGMMMRPGMGQVVGRPPMPGAPPPQARVAAMPQRAPMPILRR